MDTLLEPHSLVVSVVGVVEAYRSHVRGHSMQAMTRTIVPLRTPEIPTPKTQLVPS